MVANIFIFTRARIIQQVMATTNTSATNASVVVRGSEQCKPCYTLTNDLRQSCWGSLLPPGGGCAKICIPSVRIAGVYPAWQNNECEVPWVINRLRLCCIRHDIPEDHYWELSKLEFGLCIRLYNIILLRKWMSRWVNLAGWSFWNIHLVLCMVYYSRSLCHMTSSLMSILVMMVNDARDWWEEVKVNLFCSECAKFRKTLSRKEKRAETSDFSNTDPASHANYRYLTTAQLVDRMQQLHYNHTLSLKYIEAESYH